MSELPCLHGSEGYGIREDTVASFTFVVRVGALAPPAPSAERAKPAPMSNRRRMVQWSFLISTQELLDCLLSMNQDATMDAQEVTLVD